MVTLTLRPPDLFLVGLMAAGALTLAACVGYRLAARAFRQGISVIVQEANAAEARDAREALLDRRYTLSDAESN